MYTTARVEVIGNIWQPGMGTCATVYQMPVWPDDPPLTRDSVQDWLDTHAGDFESVEDFSAKHGETFIDWQHEDSQVEYLCCMYPDA